MGRSRRKVRTRDRANPIAKPIKPPSDPELAAVREKQILPIIADLISPDSKKRSSAAAAIANIIEDTKCRKLLLREQIVRILLEQTVTDAALEPRSVGWGILRNLALEEEADFCIHLYRQDILTAIQGIVQTIIETIASQEHPISKFSKARQNLVWTLGSSVVGLISSLAEAQDEILEAISGIPIIINSLFRLLSFDSVPAELFDETLACLAILTEDNERLTKQIVDHELWLKGLMQLRELGGSKAVAACGVLHNVFSAMQWFDHNTPIEGASDAMLISTLMQSINDAQTKQDLTNGSSHSRPDRTLQLALEITASIATSLQEALEHASHNEKEFEGFGEDTQDIGDAMVEDGSHVEERGEENTSGNGEMDEEEMDADMELVTGADVEEDEALADTQPTLDALIRTATPTILLLAKSSKDNAAVRTSALSALNNISWTVSSIDFDTGCSSLSGTWANLAQHIWSEIVSPVLASNTADVALASSITSIAWAAARSVKGRLRLQADEQRRFVALYQASRSLPPTMENGHENEKLEHEDSDPFQGLGVKCIGVLGRLALNPAPTHLNREIGIFLLTVLSALPETPAADAVEALNQIFDIYGDKEYACDDAVFWADGFYKHLEAIAPNAKKMAKSIDKRKYTELRQRADEAVLNLSRFLTYKLKERTN